jgi:hypothetical protein
MEENVAATTPFSKSLSCHFVEISRAGGWGEKENGSGSVCLEQAELFLKKYRLMRLVSGDSPEQPTLHKGPIFSAQAFLSAFLCSGNPEDLIKQLRE